MEQTLTNKIIMDNISETERLQNKGVKPTPNRILVLRELLQADRPQSLADLEFALETLDKSSIFRVLNLFVEHGIVHAIEDGSGSTKYETCKGEHECSPSDMHVHFFCESCRQTYCFESTHIPPVDLPDGFSAHTVNYMIKGICPACSKADFQD